MVSQQDYDSGFSDGLSAKIGLRIPAKAIPFIAAVLGVGGSSLFWNALPMGGDGAAEQQLAQCHLEVRQLAGILHRHEAFYAQVEESKEPACKALAIQSGLPLRHFSTRIPYKAPSE